MVEGGPASRLLVVFLRLLLAAEDAVDGTDAGHEECSPSEPDEAADERESSVPAIVRIQFHKCCR